MDSTRRMEIIFAYGVALENRQFPVGRETDLPFPKDLISEALSQELLSPSNPEMLNPLGVAFLGLESFISEDEYKIVIQYEQTIASAQKVAKEEGLESVRELVTKMADIAGGVQTIQQTIAQRYEERLAQLQKMRQLREQT